jgi:DNA polymerase
LLGILPPFGAAFLSLKERQKIMLIPPPPPVLISKCRGSRIKIGRLHSTVLPDIDFETVSYAGYIWNGKKNKFDAPAGASKKGLPAIGVATYSAHPTTDIISAAYNLKTGHGEKLWLPGDPLPLDLFAYLATYDPWAEPSYHQDGLIESHNAMFEIYIILRVLAKRYGWPFIEPSQFRCSMAKARAHGLPGSLDNLGEALNLSTKKDKEGKRLMKIFSMPRDPTKKDSRTLIKPSESPQEAQSYYAYNIGDIRTESEASERIPDLPPMELEYWLADQAINMRGVQCDVAAVNDCIAILEQALDKYNEELESITGGMVKKASEVAKLKTWLAYEYGIMVTKMRAEDLDTLLERKNLPDEVRRALQIRQLIGSASVKKVYAMARQVTPWGRLCDMAIYHGARTGRDNGDGVQPLNMPKAGPRLKWCVTTREPYGASLSGCPHCLSPFCHDHYGKFAFDKQPKETAWDAKAVDSVLNVMATRSLETVEYYFGDALLCISGCARGLFIAKPGCKLIGVDYSSIEAVTAAMLSGETWRIEAFAKGRDIYLESASRITGHSYEWYMLNGGKKHPDRQYIGKPAELGLGYGGWINGWRQFDDSDNFTDDEVKENIKAWRAASPRIVEMWGGQVRGLPWRPIRYELFGLEGMAILAIQNPGYEYAYNGITYYVENDRLYCRLLSGRLLTYHQPRLGVSDRYEDQLQISFMGWNSNPKKGPLGWVRMPTHGAQLFENVDQAVSRDIMAHAVVKLEKTKRYDVVLRVHDEIVTEVEDGKGTVAEQIEIMTDLPDWCKGWPIRAAGWEDGPRKRYQKD